ncbi:MAG: SMP-30/gluconolactonase/LRE family protein [Chitinophagaceae bacterium]
MTKNMNYGVEVFDVAGKNFTDTAISVLADGFSFAEGPVWHPGGYLLFSDTPANKIYRVFIDGRFQVFLENSGLNNGDMDKLSDQVGSNGLAFTADKQLLICQHGNHAVSVLNEQKQLGILAGTFNGRKFNSPNDIITRSDGIIYFTDPPYGLKDQVLAPHEFQPLAGVYQYTAGAVKLVATDLRYPNGLAFSPGEEYLYVSSAHSDEEKLLRYEVMPDGSLSFNQIVIEEGADGMVTDARGLLYLATEKGILIISGEGEKLALINLPEWPSNMAWCAEDLKILFVTARKSIYRLQFL